MPDVRDIRCLKRRRRTISGTIIANTYSFRYLNTNSEHEEDLRFFVVEDIDRVMKFLVSFRNKRKKIGVTMSRTAEKRLARKRVFLRVFELVLRIGILKSAHELEMLNTSNAPSMNHSYARRHAHTHTHVYTRTDEWPVT